MQHFTTWTVWEDIFVLFLFFISNETWQNDDFHLYKCGKTKLGVIKNSQTYITRARQASFSTLGWAITLNRQKKRGVDTKAERSTHPSVGESCHKAIRLCWLANAAVYDRWNVLVGSYFSCIFANLLFDCNQRLYLNQIFSVGRHKADAVKSI